LHAQEEPLTDNSIFIFTRSTLSKIDYIAKDFNISDTLSTHVGLGLLTTEGFKIFNVTNDKNPNDSALICESLESFIAIDDIKYYSVWEAKLSDKVVKKISEILDKYSKLKIEFDYEFNILDDNKLYCSEFVLSVLQKANPNKFYFKPLKKDLNQFYERALSRSRFEYIPVDFFTQLNHFKKIDERYYLNEN
jgi:hypothetical protein